VSASNAAYWARGTSTRETPPSRRLLLSAILVFAGYYVGAEIGSALTLSPNPIAVLWPPNSILLAALLLAPMSAWPILILAAVPAHLIVELHDGVPPLMVLCWFVSNATEALIGAICIRRLTRDRLHLDSVHHVGAFIICGVFLAPFLSSFLDAGFVRLIGWGQSTYEELWRTRFFSNVVAALTIVPLIITTATTAPQIRHVRHMTLRRAAEAAALACGLVFVGVLAFDLQAAAFKVPFAALYLPLPFLLWAALRFGPAGASASFATIAFLAIWGAAHGQGPFSSSAPRENAMAIQLFLTFVGITLFALSSFVSERNRTEKILRASEERFARAFHASPDAMAISRRLDGRLIEVNEQWLALFGCTRNEVIGRTMTEVQGVADGNQAEKIAALSHMARDVQDLELVFSSAKGEVVHGLVASKAVEMEGESRFITIIRDDTERHHAQLALRESEARFRSMADKAPVMIWMSGTDQQCTFFNKGWLDFVGCAMEQQIGEAWTLGLHPDDRERCLRTYSTAFDERRNFVMEYRLRRNDGEYRWILDCGVPRVEDDGTFLGYIGSCIDISERYELQQMRQDLAHVTRISTMGELAASLAHELNQPLTAIMSNVQAAQRFLAGGVVDVKELTEILNDIMTDDRRASEVIRRMRALATKGELEMAPLDLAGVLREVSMLVQSDAIVRGVHVSIELNGSLPARGDRVQLQQVFLNLLLNAFDAVKDRPPAQRSVIVAAERSADDTISVAVRDSGVGLSPDKVDKIFTPFFTSKPDGLGLGLSISRSIVEAHGGRLRAENNADCGATFHLVLPLSRETSFEAKRSA
jgi:two-component system sensor kinase FixL